MKKLLWIILAAVAAGAWHSQDAEAQVVLPPIVIPICGTTIACGTVNVVPAVILPSLTIGHGRVTSEPPGIDCVFAAGVRSGTCSHTFQGSSPQTPPVPLVVRLTATAAPGSLSCIGVGCFPRLLTEERRFTTQHTTDLYFNFALVAHPLTVTRTGDGTGSVVSSPAGIDCGSACSGWYDHGTRVTLDATADAGAEFRGWTGACAGQPSSCSLTVDAATATNAVFALKGSTQPPGPQPPAPPPSPGPQPGPQPVPQPGPQPDPRLVEVDIIGHMLGRSALGFRLVRVEVELDERVAATLVLTRGKRTLLKKTVPTLSAGRRVVTLVLPRRIVKGRAYLTLRLRDADGNTRSWGRSVLIQRSGR